MKDTRCVAAVTVCFHSRCLSETQVGSPAKLSPVGQGPAGRCTVIYRIWYFVLFCPNINSGNGLSSSALEMFKTWSTSSELMLNPQSQKIIYTRQTTDSAQAVSVKYHFFDFITRKGNPFLCLHYVCQTLSSAGFYLCERCLQWDFLLQTRKKDFLFFRVTGDSNDSGLSLNTGWPPGLLSQ